MWSPFRGPDSGSAVAAVPLQSVFGHCSRQRFASHYALLAIGRVKAMPHAPPDAAECVLPCGHHARLAHQATGYTMQRARTISEPFATKVAFLNGANSFTA